MRAVEDIVLRERVRAILDADPGLEVARIAELLIAIDTVLRDKRSSRALLSQAGLPAPLAQLTQREMQVLKRIAGGARNREIALELAISVKTVEKHRSNLMRKLKLRNTAALTGFAIENRLLTTG
jgi:DNA-binding NarL/FixJ family response regulator